MLFIIITIYVKCINLMIHSFISDNLINKKIILNNNK